jgi:hypothetical protein
MSILDSLRFILCKKGRGDVLLPNLFLEIVVRGAIAPNLNAILCGHGPEGNMHYFYYMYIQQVEYLCT